MPVSIGAPAQASFEQPLELLKDCHRRIESFLEVLLRVVATARSGPLGEEGRRALQAGLRYFREVAHVRATTLHDAVNACGEQWLRDGQLSAEALTTVRRQLEELRELYRRHI